MSQTPTSRTLKVPGATLYYEVRGQGPVLLMIPGGPTDAGIFAGLAAALADRYTVVAYDPRGNSRSVFDATPVEQDMDVNADDAAALIDALGGAPVCVLGSSGGAQIGLDLAARHPEKVRVLVAHEPPCVLLLPDPAQGQAVTDAVYDTWKSQGAGPAMGVFMQMAGLGGEPPQPQAAPPNPEAGAAFARIGGNIDYFLGHGFRPISNYIPDVAALRAGPAAVVVGVGEDSAGQLAWRSATALAKQLGTPANQFPGDHGGYGAQPEAFATRLDEVLRGG